MAKVKCLTLLLFHVMISLNPTFGAFQHEVIPSCGPEKKICEFAWHITKLETLVWYDHFAATGYPLLVRDGLIQLRDRDNCTGFTPITHQQLDEVFTADGVHRYVYAINNQFPGPSIVVYEGQQVVVRVTNGLLQEGTTIHWHGMIQRRTNYMDGTGSVTQCPINPGETFTYRFIATPAGTHWYHSHYGLQRTDGLSGALIVLPRPGNENTTVYDREESNSVYGEQVNVNTGQQEQHPKFPAYQNKDGAKNESESIVINSDENSTADKQPPPKQPGAGAGTTSRSTPASSSSTQIPPPTSPEPNTPMTFTKEFVFLVHDWFHEDSDDVFVSYYYEIAKYLWDGYNNTESCHTRTQQLDGGEVGTVPFLSALINGKGQYYRNYGEQPIDVPAETFNVSSGGLYRFRVINSGMNFAMKLSIDQHKLHLIASDGMYLQEVVADYLIVHTGERYDFYIVADQPAGEYTIRAQTLEATQGMISEWELPYSMVSPGGSNAILQYNNAQSVTESKPRACTPEDPCKVVNCPFKEFPAMANATCTNYNDLRSLKPNNLPKTKGIEEHFLNFHFPVGTGNTLRSQVNGIQFQAPDTPPTVTNGAVYMNGCDQVKCAVEPCHCTHQVNITRDNEVIMVLSSTVTNTSWEGLPATVHPVHLHGHHFQVLKTGYANLDPVTMRYKSLNPDIQCKDPNCLQMQWADPAWSGGNIPYVNLEDPPLKDTVTVPVGGYVVIRFAADNPGWWIMHCHVELHQVEGMALIIQEGQPKDMTTPPPNFPTCGWFDWSEEEFERKISGTAGIHGGSLAMLLFVALSLLI